MRQNLSDRTSYQTLFRKTKAALCPPIREMWTPARSTSASRLLLGYSSDRNRSGLYTYTRELVTGFRPLSCNGSTVRGSQPYARHDLVLLIYIPLPLPLHTFFKSDGFAYRLKGVRSWDLNWSSFSLVYPASSNEVEWHGRSFGFRWARIYRHRRYWKYPLFHLISLLAAFACSTLQN